MTNLENNRVFIELSYVDKLKNCGIDTGCLICRLIFIIITMTLCAEGLATLSMDESLLVDIYRILPMRFDLIHQAPISK